MVAYPVAASIAIVPEGQRTQCIYRVCVQSGAASPFEEAVQTLQDEMNNCWARRSSAEGAAVVKAVIPARAMRNLEAIMLGVVLKLLVCDLK